MLAAPTDQELIFCFRMAERLKENGGVVNADPVARERRMKGEALQRVAMYAMMKRDLGSNHPLRSVMETAVSGRS